MNKNFKVGEEIKTRRGTIIRARSLRESMNKNDGKAGNVKGIFLTTATSAKQKNPEVELRDSKWGCVNLFLHFAAHDAGRQ